MKRRDFSETYIPFATAAFAAGISEKRARNWLDRDLIFLDANEQRDESRHRRFSELDCVRLALVARLTLFGFSAEEASKILEDVFHKIPLSAEYPGKTKPSYEEALLGALSTLSMTFYYRDEGEGVSSYTYDDRKPEPSEVRALDCRLTIKVGRIVERMYDILEATGLWKKDKK
jgi:DNA-binding transcriptional MerR regulator